MIGKGRKGDSAAVSKSPIYVENFSNDTIWKDFNDSLGLSYLAIARMDCPELLDRIDIKRSQER